MVERKRILSGMRPTGRLHLGNLHGALENWIQLQNQYDCYFFVADWHALTTDYASPQGIRENTWDMILDWLSAGLDPKLCTMFIQSEIKEHAELYLLLAMITPLPWLERNPTYKEQQQQLDQKGPRDLRLSGLSGAPGRRHHHIPSKRCSRRKRPAPSHRVDQGNSPQVQFHV